MKLSRSFWKPQSRWSTLQLTNNQEKLMNGGEMALKIIVKSSSALECGSWIFLWLQSPAIRFKSRVVYELLMSGFNVGHGVVISTYHMCGWTLFCVQNHVFLRLLWLFSFTQLKSQKWRSNDALCRLYETEMNSESFLMKCKFEHI